MLNKTQKIWTWIFIAMFAIPEILWSPIGNFLHTFWRGGNTPAILRNNFLMHSDYRGLLIFVIFLQSFGALACLVLTYKSSTKNWLKASLTLLLLLFFILSFVILSVLLLTLNVGLVM